MTDDANRRTINGETEAARRFAEYCVEVVRQYTPDDSGIGLHKMIGINFKLAVRDAVDAEQERCAEIARSYAARALARAAPAEWSVADAIAGEISGGKP